MRRILLFILLLGLTLPLFASRKKQVHDPITYVSPVGIQYRLNGTIGWLNPDEKIVGDKNTTGISLDRPVTLGGTFAIEFLPTYRHKAFRQWNNTSVGLAFTALDLGNKEYLGQIFSIYPYLNIPLYKSPHFVFGLRPGMGLAFVTKNYANTCPEQYRYETYKIPDPEGPKPYKQVANMSVGSTVNAWITAGAYIDVPIDHNWTLNFSFGWQHVSNGSIKTPNAGYNMANGEIGVTYRPNSRMHYVAPQTLVPHELYDGVKRNWDVEIGIAGGCRSVYYRDQTWFGVGSFGIAAYWRPVSIFRLGGGVDVFYDGGYTAVNYEYRENNPGAPVTKFGKTYLKESKVSNCFRVGISIQPEMVLGDFTFGYHMGLYLYDPVKNLEPKEQAVAADESGTPLQRGLFYKYDPTRASTYQDGWFYQKLQLKYHCTKHLYVQVGLKLHIMKAEFIDAGIGLHI